MMNSPSDRVVGASILIVDDDRSLARALALLARDMLGITTTVAYDAAEALRLIEHEPFDLVLTDVFMPGDGRSVVRAMHERSPDTPVVVMTAMTDRYSRDEALALGAIELLAKPFSPEDLAEVLERALSDGRSPITE